MIRARPQSFAAYGGGHMVFKIYRAGDLHNKPGKPGIFNVGQFEARRRTARFCGARCRKVAERRRGEPSKMDVTVNRRPSALAVGTRSPKSAERTSRCAASSAADVTLNHPVDIVPDAHWPNMWRFACGCHKKSIGRRDRN